MKNNIIKICSVIVSVIISFNCFSQSKNTATEDYILKYREIALENESQYGIPASITLAQGIIESGSGRSSLAKEGNNHFGIKCHQSWTGKKMYKDDDNKNDCFRVYSNAEESFTDHSLFLKQGKRYAFLFDIDKSDYKSWAKGLKQAGYATNPKYAELLIDIIEVYDLDKITANDYYLIADNESVQTVKENTVSNEQPEQSNQDTEPAFQKKTSLMEKIFGKTAWWQRRHETPEQKKRRQMDKQIQKMIDKQDVQREDFEVKFE